MRKQELIAGVGVLSLLLLLIVGCGGGGNGGGNGGGTGTSVTATITGAAFVAVQDGKTGAWQRLSGSGPDYNFNVTATDGRYSIAWVCEGTKLQVNIIHTTTAETTSIAARCPTSATTITASGTVQGLNSGQTALVSIGSQTQTVSTNGGSFNLTLLPGTHDIIAVRFGASGPNKVWLRRNVTINSNTSGLSIDFNQPDGTVVRVFDVSAGTLTVAGADPSETVSSQISLQSSGRFSLLGLGSFTATYPLFPAGILEAGENFRIVADTDAQRGEVRGLNSLPNSLSITLPTLFNSLFDFTSAGALTFTVRWSAYTENPVRGYRLTLGGDQQQRNWHILITTGWLGSDTQYTTPVLNTLNGWNSTAWDIQRGRPVNASFTVLVSSNSVQQLLEYERTGIAPTGFQLRFATRSVILTP
ncbi:hypothetical protein HRbin15_00950 [bacterium HR15]|nr:hypothetical protein HRbin15_00950 [bacterium HR15]